MAGCLGQSFGFYFQMYVGLNPNDVDSLIWLGCEILKMKSYGEARHYYCLALQKICDPISRKHEEYFPAVTTKTVSADTLPLFSVITKKWNSKKQKILNNQQVALQRVNVIESLLAIAEIPTCENIQEQQEMLELLCSHDMSNVDVR